MTQETFSDRLRQAMSDRDVRQSDVIRASEMLGKKLGKSQMSQYVSGKTIPRRDVAELLARILEVDVTWLLAGDADQGETSSTHNVSKPEPYPSAQIARSTTMRTFSKSTKLENVLYDVRGPVVDEAARMEDEGECILKLNIGNPAPFGFRTPDEVIKDMRQQLPDCEGYSNSRGLFSARKAIMQYSQIKGLPNVQMEHIYTGNGVSELIQLSMNALLDNGDEILIPSPIIRCGRRAQLLPVDIPCTICVMSRPIGIPICRIWSPRSRARPRPSSSSTQQPHGLGLSARGARGIVEIARRHQLMILPTRSMTACAWTATSTSPLHRSPPTCPALRLAACPSRI